ncbi:MAG: restriction endonuclease subunit S [Williamsia sp.]|nr:restriction endonuclease subunit S [Williamsia sp.]
MSKEEKNRMVPRLRFAEFRDSREWEEKMLDELFIIGSGKDYKHLGKGDIPVYGSGGYMLSVDEYLYNGESVCIGRKGTIDRPLFLSGKFWTVDTLFYTHSFNQCIPKFVYLLFQNINWLKHNEAGGIPSLSKTIIGKIEVLVPGSEEQQKIADCLSSLDEYIIAESQQLEALKAHKKGLMQQLFPAEDETVPQLRFAEFRESGEWEEKRLDQLLQFKNGLNASKELYGKGVKFINVLDILQNEFITYEMIIGSVDVSEEIVKNFSVDYGDILFQRSSETQEEVGTTNVYLDQQRTSTFGGFVIRGKKIGEYEPVFLNKLLKTQTIRTSIQSKSGGSTRFNIGQETLSSTKVLLPSIIEQKTIADCLSSLDELIAAQTEKIEALKLHKKGMMQGLFPNTNEVSE